LSTLQPPPLESAVPASKPPGPLHRVARRLRILVVDDEPAVGAVLRRVFRGSHDVTVVQKGSAALSMIDGGADFDVLLCDVVMPDLTGPEVYEALRTRHARLLDRFVFITGGALQESARRFLGSVTAPVLYKPFDLGAVRELVRRITTA
jgi:CheY-like chemotaxis protein